MFSNFIKLQQISEIDNTVKKILLKKLNPQIKVTNNNNKNSKEIIDTKPENIYHLIMISKLLQEIILYDNTTDELKIKIKNHINNKYIQIQPLLFYQLLDAKINGLGNEERIKFYYYENENDKGPLKGTSLDINTMDILKNNINKMISDKTSISNFINDNDEIFDVILFSELYYIYIKNHVENWDNKNETIKAISELENDECINEIKSIIEDVSNNCIFNDSSINTIYNKCKGIGLQYYNLWIILNEYLYNDNLVYGINDINENNVKGLNHNFIEILNRVIKCKDIKPYEFSIGRILKYHYKKHQLIKLYNEKNTIISGNIPGILDNIIYSYKHQGFIYNNCLLLRQMLNKYNRNVIDFLPYNDNYLVMLYICYKYDNTRNSYVQNNYNYVPDNSIINQLKLVLFLVFNSLEASYLNNLNSTNQGPRIYNFINKKYKFKENENTIIVKNNYGVETNIDLNRYDNLQNFKNTTDYRNNNLAINKEKGNIIYKFNVGFIQNIDENDPLYKNRKENKPIMKTSKHRIINEITNNKKITISINDESLIIGLEN